MRFKRIIDIRIPKLQVSRDYRIDLLESHIRGVVIYLKTYR